MDKWYEDPMWGLVIIYSGPIWFSGIIWVGLQFYNFYAGTSLTVRDIWLHNY